MTAPRRLRDSTKHDRRLPSGLALLVDQKTIARRLGRMAQEIHRELANGSRPIAVIVLQGGFIFAADLLRRLPPDFAIDVAFLRCQSYGTRRSSSGRVLLMQDIEPDIDLRGRTVLLIDDILDTGLTMKFLVEHLRKRGARDVRLCVLLDRTHLAGKRKIEPEFAGFPVGTEFVVGYGLDHGGKYRHLPHLAALPFPGKRQRKTRKK